MRIRFKEFSENTAQALLLGIMLMLIFIGQYVPVEYKNVYGFVIMVGYVVGIAVWNYAVQIKVFKKNVLKLQIHCFDGSSDELQLFFTGYRVYVRGENYGGADSNTNRNIK